MTKKHFLILLLALAFVACEQASNTVVSMPNVEINCQDTGCDNTLSGDTVFVIVTRSGCGDSASFDPVASGDATVTCSSSGCVGTVSSWTDKNGNDVTEIITGRHDVCGYIDANNDTSQNTGDMETEDEAFINSSTTIVLDSWSATN